MAVEILTAENFDQVTKSGLVLVDFWAQWCGPCKMLGPIVDQLAEEYAGKVTVCKVNVDEQTDLAQQFSVMSIPNLILFKDGEVAENMVGLRPKEELMQVLDSNL